MILGAKPWELTVAGLVGFAAGSVNPATIVARARGVNLQEIGSGNPGATNTARALGVRTGVAVGVVDVLKGFVPAATFSAWGGQPAGEVAGLAAVLGHIFSPFLQGKGGKGVATTLGAVLGVEPLWAVPMLLAFGGTVAATKRMGIGAVAGAVVLVGTGLWLGDEPDERLFAVSLGTVVIIRHQGNIRDLLMRRQDRAE